MLDLYGAVNDGLVKQQREYFELGCNRGRRSKGKGRGRRECAKGTRGGRERNACNDVIVLLVFLRSD